MKKGINLVDILITMAIMSVIFSLTLPILTNKSYEKEVLVGFDNFNTTLQGSIDTWKSSIFCPFKVGKCIQIQKNYYSVQPNFNQIGQYMNIYLNIDKHTNDISYLPEKTLDYSGKNRSTYDFRKNNKREVYMLLNGIVFSVLPDSEGYWIIVDVNGKKPPNRIGKDTFHLTVGYNTDSDINYYAKNKTNDGICGHLDDTAKVNCDGNNVNPNIGNGASPTAYLLINNKLPDFKILSEKIPGFKP